MRYEKHQHNQDKLHDAQFTYLNILIPGWKIFFQTELPCHGC